jgi:hypothetical protein
VASSRCRSSLLGGGAGYSVPASLGGQPFQAGATLFSTSAWTAPGVDPAARRAFALRTCDGCHQQETSTNIQQVTRSLSGPAMLSGFLLGEAILDPVDSQQVVDYDDLGRRKLDLTKVVCPSDPLPPARCER